MMLVNMPKQREQRKRVNLCVMHKLELMKKLEKDDCGEMVISKS